MTTDLINKGQDTLSVASGILFWLSYSRSSFWKHRCEDSTHGMLLTTLNAKRLSPTEHTRMPIWVNGLLVMQPNKNQAEGLLGAVEAEEAEAELSSTSRCKRTCLVASFRRVNTLSSWSTKVIVTSKEWSFSQVPANVHKQGRLNSGAATLSFTVGSYKKSFKISSSKVLSSFLDSWSNSLTKDARSAQIWSLNASPSCHVGFWMTLSKEVSNRHWFRRWSWDGLKWASSVSAATGISPNGRSLALSRNMFITAASRTRLSISSLERALYSAAICFCAWRAGELPTLWLP